MALYPPVWVSGHGYYHSGSAIERFSGTPVDACLPSTSRPCCAHFAFFMPFSAMAAAIADSARMGWEDTPMGSLSPSSPCCGLVRWFCRRCNSCLVLFFIPHWFFLRRGQSLLCGLVDLELLPATHLPRWHVLVCVSLPERKAMPDRWYNME